MPYCYLGDKKIFVKNDCFDCKYIKECWLNQGKTQEQIDEYLREKVKIPKKVKKIKHKLSLNNQKIYNRLWMRHRRNELRKVGNYDSKWGWKKNKDDNYIRRKWNTIRSLILK